MNQIAWQIFGGSKAKANTFIGGVASVITTSGALATRLGIASNRITNFKIVGSDIECRISGSYVITAFWTGIELLISYYRDFDGLVTSIGYQAFYGTNVREVYTPNATSIIDTAFDQNLNNGQDKNALKMLYIPRVTTIGTTVLNNNVFRNGNLGGAKIYAHPSLQTINAGGVEGDLAYLATGNIIRYVTNFTAPNPITNLSVGNVYGTAVQLNFTAPSSANAIDYYECYANGVYKNTITASGQYIGGLSVNTTYTIEVKPVDIFYNKSTSNTIAVTTANISYTDTDANAYISAATLTGAEQESAYQLITDLKTAGLWTKIQALYPFKGTTVAQHKWNAKNPLDTNAAFRLTFSGTGTYSNLGFQTNGSNSYANTNFIPRTNLSPTNCGTTIVSGTNNATSTSDVQEIGCQTSGIDILRQSVKSDNTNYFRQAYISNHAVYTSGVNEARGVFTQSKTSNSLLKSYRNSVILGQATTTVTGTIPNVPIWIGVCNGNGRYSNQRIQIAIIHEGLTDAEVATLHTIIDTSETIAGRKTW